MNESPLFRGPGPAPATPPAIFRARRERLLQRIGAGVVVVEAAPELLRSRDTEVPFRPGTDLYYLTGVEEPEAVAVLSPHEPGAPFTLFVRPRDLEREAWTGARLGVEGAAARYEPDAVYPIGELPERLPELLRPADRVHYPLDVSPGLERLIRELLLRFRTRRPRTGLGPTGLEDLDATLGEMRRVKDQEEIARLRTAARIAAAGHLAALRAARPEAGEWEVEAALEAQFRALGATGPAFPSIVGSGPNATILHYTTNNRRIRDGDLVLVDAGAEWGMYCSDITRTFPASGRFSGPQRAVYDIVLAAEEAGIATARPGEPVGAVHDAAVRVLTDGLRGLGLLRGELEELLVAGAYRRFYLHQTSHWLGLDVHDAGMYREGAGSTLLQPGMVLTVEPGLYLSADDREIPEPFRGIGVRIEDSLLITDTGHELLTRDVPVDPGSLEALVRGA